MRLLLKNGTVVHPSVGSVAGLDLLIGGNKIEKIGPGVVATDAITIDVTGKLVVPGLIDVHVHFREPGQEYKEGISSGSRAAAAGGFTAVIAEPNTIPPIDTAARLRRILDIAQRRSVIRYFSKGCISKGMRGRELTAVGELKEAGARAISDDGHPVAGRKLMRNALAKGLECGILVNPHCEESELYRRRMAEKRGRQMELVSEEPYSAEDRFIKRDIELAKATGARIHISHVSLASSVRMIATAKSEGVRITAEATPHHFTLTREMAAKIGANAKVIPPLRSEEDVEAVRRGLADGTIDIIASDHAPHTPEEKSAALERAPFGIIGLETTLGLVLTHLVRPGILTLMQAIEKMTILPARIFGLEGDGIGSLRPGDRADVTVIDPEMKWRVDANAFYSKGRNCPFHGWPLHGKAIMTIIGGQVVMQDGEVAVPHLEHRRGAGPA
jgi:dihydroorotase